MSHVIISNGSPLCAGNIRDLTYSVDPGLFVLVSVFGSGYDWIEQGYEENGCFVLESSGARNPISVFELVEQSRGMAADAPVMYRTPPAGELYPVMAVDFDEDQRALVLS